MSPQLSTVLMFLFEGVLLALVSLPLIRGRVPRNPFYGFRTRRTLSADDIWYPANRYAGRALFWAGAATFLGALALLPFAGRLSVDAVALLGLALTLIPLGVAVYRSFRYLRRL